MPTTVKEMLAAARAVVPTIAPKDAVALIGRPDVLLVDVRDSHELRDIGKIPGAVNVSRGMLEFRADPTSPLYDKVFDQEKTVIVYCALGARAALAGKTLLELGYTKVHNLGAFKDWVEGGGQVEKI
jgi:rhodanese-related sulfurtransferase